MNTGVYNIISSPVRRVIYPQYYPNNLPLAYDYQRCLLIENEVKRLGQAILNLDEENTIMEKDNTVLTSVIDQRDTQIRNHLANNEA